MKFSLEIRPSQTISPQMITTMTVLQLGSEELSDYLAEQSYENPMMDLTRPEVTGAELAKQFRYIEGAGTSRFSAGEAGEGLPLSQQVNTLEEFLREQILMMSVPRDVEKVLYLLVELLDEHGLYQESAEELSEMAGCSLDTAEEALRRFRALEPVGVGAESMKASLLTQLRALPEDTLLAERLLESMEPGKTPAAIAGKLGVTTREIEIAMEQIGALHPSPADGFSFREETVYVRPDLYIMLGEDGLSVQENQNLLPKISLNSEYLAMLERETDPEVQKYLQKKFQQTKQLMYNLHNRSSTMLRCGEIIARRQEEFFRGGSISKLTLRDVAEEMEVHESTVSRTVKDKYIQCDRGLFPMSHFFSRGVGQNLGLSREHIQEVLRRIIAEEPDYRPHSDQTLVKLLEKENIRISRRAVAKYRNELKIPTSGSRKREKSVV